MDIQDFQEQDFMEILMRLPCFFVYKLFSSRGETIPLARVKYSLRKDNAFSSRGEYVLFGFDRGNDWWFLV